MDILCCYWCWLQSDPALLLSDSRAAKPLPPLFLALSYYVSVPPCLHCLTSPSLSVFCSPFPRWLLLKLPWDWPERFLRSDGKNVWEMRWRTKGSCRGPFQHAGQLCYLDQELCRRMGATWRIGQGKAINTLWNWSRKFRKCCKGKQHCIMYLLTFPCIAWLAKDDKKWNALVFLSAIDFIFSPLGHKPLAFQFGMEQQVFLLYFFFYLFVGDKLLCLMRHTRVLCRKMKCNPSKDTGKHGPCSHLSNYRPGTEECHSERQMVQGCCFSLTSSILSLCPFPPLSLWSPVPQYFMNWFWWLIADVQYQINWFSFSLVSCS